jgi:formylglycine-generating enzyme required for sulfatase activity/serine/threonine protein kinase
MTADETRLEDDAPVEEERTRLEGSDPDETVLEGGVGKRSEGFGLVGQSFEGGEKSYLVLEELEASGAEADVYVVEEQGSDDRRVLKYYRRGIRPKAEITEMLAGLDKEHVVQVYETGVRDGRSYEIQEFVEHGSLADMVTSGGLPEVRMKEVLHELLIAVEHLHERNVIHRDLKPANVLVRTLDPLDLVFIDFGISSQTEHSLHATSASRTVTYASPEALTGVVAKASDWWSVGVILLELLTGKHPFAGLNEQAVNFQLVSKGIEVPVDIAGDWQLLLKGLLTRDREKRWGSEQVRKWLKGERSIATGYDDDHAEERETKKYDYKPYKFKGKDFHSPASLAKALAENRQQAEKDFGRGLLTEWVKEQVGDQELFGLLMDAGEDETLDPSQRLSVVLMVLNGELPLLDEEGVLSRESLPSRASGLAGILSSGLGRWLKELRGEDWLLALGKKYQEFEQEIDKHRKHLDEGLANQLFLLDEEELEGKWSEFLREYGGCKVSRLNQSFKGENPNRIDKIAILSLRRELLKTRKKVCQETLRSSLGDCLKHVDEQKAFALDLLDEEKIDSKWSELLREYGGCQVSRLNQSFKTENPTRLYKIAILSLQRELLKTHEEVHEEVRQEVRRDTLRSSLGDYLEHVDEQKAFALDLLDEDELEGKWKELRREYVGCNVPRLNQSFKAENPPRIDKIAFLSLPRKLLVTQGETATEGEEFTVYGLSLEMLWCAPGIFEMGSPEGKKITRFFSHKIVGAESGRQLNEVQHEVTLTQGFWLGKHPVTQAQWEKVMGSNSSRFRGVGRPVERVSWDAAMSFCLRLTELERKAGRLPAGMTYQLPTEAQWEYACRAGTKTAYAFGDSLNSDQANIYGGPEETTNMGKYPANGWGFCDMHGNVWEWCADWYGDYPSGAARDPIGLADGSVRVLRGGSWSYSADSARSASRDCRVPASSDSILGFRLSLRPTSK